MGRQQEREELAKIADKLPDQYRKCRLKGHDYDPLTVTERGRFTDVTVRCSRGCGSERSFTMDRDGQYVEPPRQTGINSDYYVKGFGHGASMVVRGHIRLQHYRGRL